MTFLIQYLPRKWLSRQIGFLVHIRGPWSSLLIWLFAEYYNINLSEAEKPLELYPSLGEFFIRQLKEGVRPLAQAWAVQPADSKVTEFGEIENGTLIQAKGITYKLAHFIEDPDALDKYDNGTFITYYLCPTDYHRVHSPVAGLVRSVTYMPGDLWPVNEWSVKNIAKLFRTNERMYVEIATEFGPVGVVFVGATNVGSIELSFGDKIKPAFKTNAGQRPRRHILDIPHEINIGEELGMFRMGSTVVLLLNKEIREKFVLMNIASGRHVKVCSALTNF